MGMILFGVLCAISGMLIGILLFGLTAPGGITLRLGRESVADMLPEDKPMWVRGYSPGGRHDTRGE